MSAPGAGPQGISPSQAVEHALALLDTDPAAAERQALEILKILPLDTRAIFIVGAARRRAGDLGGARTVLEQLTVALPDSPHAHHELGLTLAGQGEAAAAVAVLRRAAELRRDAPETWLALSEQLRLGGDAEGAAHAYAEHVRTSVRDPGLRDAMAALQGRRFGDAERLLRDFLQRTPDDLSALRMLGETACELGHLDDAEEILAHCVAQAPGFVGARHNYALVLYRQNKFPEAVAEIERLLAGSPGEPKYLTLLAASLGAWGEFERSLAILADVLALHPTQATVWLNYGQTLRIVGRGEEAVAAMNRAIAIEPRLGEAYWSLADLKTVQPSHDRIKAMRHHLTDATLGTDDRIYFHYGLGRALEVAEQWEESFFHYAIGAQERRRLGRYDPDKNTAWTEICKAVHSRAFFEARLGGGAPDPAPIFVVGMPRAGSTLVEQILAGHSEVEATMELPDIALIGGGLGRPGRKTNGQDYPEVTTGLSPEARLALGRNYLARARPRRKLGRPHFIDKMPTNFLHVGLITLILPQAKIIDVRRHPMASGFAAFKQHFFAGQEFSYDLSDVGRYYNDYHGLMAHFDAVMPGRIHRIVYEDLVENTEAEVRRMLAYCGLAFEAPCLRFWEGGRIVSTHSSEQVRRPIFRGGLDHWRHYQPWLAPLRAALGPVLETWRGTPA